MSGIPGLAGVRCGQCHEGMKQLVTSAPEGLIWRNEPCPHCVAGWVAWFPEEKDEDFLNVFSGPGDPDAPDGMGG